MFGRLKFRTQLYILFTIVIVFIITAMLGMLYLVLRDSYRMQESSALQANSRQIAINIDNRMDSYLSYLRVLSANRQLITAMETQPYARVAEVLGAAAGPYMSMNVARLRDIRIHEKGVGGQADGLGDLADIFAAFSPGSQIYRNNLLVTGVYLNARNEKVFSMFQKVYQTNAGREFLLEMCVYETELLGFFNEDNSGNHITVYSGDWLLSMNDRHALTLLLYGAKTSGLPGVRGQAGTGKPIAFTAGTKNAVRVVIETDNAYLDRAYRAIALRMAMVTAVVAATAFFIVWQVGARLNRRMRQLSDKIVDISNWKLEHDITLRGEDEFSLLARELDETRRRILALAAQADRDNQSKREAEVSALRAQINSHFLFNSLSSIKWLSKRNDHEQLTEAVDKLAVFLRYSLSLKEDLVPLRVELEHLNAYSYLQKLRYGDEVNVHTDIAEELLGLLTLKLLLQPLVENAIYHGRREDGAPLNITIYSADAGDGYELIVEDDGNGMSEERIRSVLEDAPREQRGYGLRNVISRLRMCRGEDASLSIRSDPGVCTRIIVRQPKTGEHGAEDLLRINPS
jgi:signal transduction histidine kinase